MTHDETNHADLTTQEEKDLNAAIMALTEAGALVDYIQGKAEAEQERLEAARERSALAARLLFDKLEKLPGGVYYAGDNLTYHAETKGIRHPDGTLTLVKAVTARDPANATILYTGPETAKGPANPTRTNAPQKTLQQERRDGEALAAAYRDARRTQTEAAIRAAFDEVRKDLADTRKQLAAEEAAAEATSYSATPRQGILVGGIIEAGPALRPQPKWPAGEEPDYITEITGGFVDGTGRAHPAPPRIPLGGPTHHNAARKIAGKWRWYTLDPSRS